MLDPTPDDVTEGSLVRALVGLALPLLLQNVTQVAQQVVDVIFLGRVGEDAVAAVGLAFPVVTTLVALAVMIPYVGTQVLVATRVGRDDRAGARRVAVHGAGIGIVLGGVAALAGVLGAGPIASLLGPGGAETRLAATYLATYALAFPFMGLADGIEGAFTGVGDTRAAFLVTVTTVGVNVLLDPVFIFGAGPIPALGVRGAALATAVGVLAGALVALRLAVGPRESFTLSRSDVVPDPAVAREVVDVGAPILAQRVGQDAVRVVLVALVAAAGGAAGLAAYTVGTRVAMVAVVPASGLQGATQSVVGQNLGADSPGRAERATWTSVVGAGAVLAVLGLLQWAAPVPIVRLVVPGASGPTLDLSVTYLRVLALGYPAIGVAYAAQAGFNGAQATRTSTAISLVQFGLVRLPLALAAVWLLAAGVVGVFWAVTLSNAFAAVLAAGYYRYATRYGSLHAAAAEPVAGGPTGP
jgi:putative MATE family efflux protein